MSRASNLAGFITAISPPVNLNVGVLTATTFDLGGSISFTDIEATNSLAIGGTVAGVTTITGTGINQPLGINTLGQTEFKGAVEFNDNLSSITIAGITTINSDGVQSTGIGTFETVNSTDVVATGIATFNSVAIGTESFFPLDVYHPTINTVAKFKSGDAGVNIRFQDGNTTNQMGIGADNNDFIVSAASGGERVRVQSGGNVGIGSTAPTVSVDISEKTDAVALPVGTTAQRPATAYGGYIRWNSTSSALEVYNGTNWVELISDYFPSGSTTLG